MKKILLFFITLLIILIMLSACNKYHYGSFYNKPSKRDINKAMKKVGWEYEQPKIKMYNIFFGI